MNENQSKKMVKSLKQSPLYAISKCGIELAHSNFWKWMIEIELYKDFHKINPFIEVFIPDFYKKGYELINVERERDNMDLLISFRTKDSIEKKLIIENKIKSIPTREQLTKYQEKTGDRFYKGIITGIIKTLENIKDWEFLSYTKIADNIASILNKQKELDSFTKSILEHYIKDLNNINNLVIGLNKSNLYQWDGVDILEDIKLNDLFKKIQGCKLAKEISKRIHKNMSKFVINEHLKLCEPIVTFNHKNTTITTIYKFLTEKEEEKGRIGIQIEGKQFRIYGGPSSPSSSLKKAGILYEKFVEIGWFQSIYENSKENKSSTKNKGQLKIMGNKSSLTKKYCQYQTSTYTHIYQYWDIEDKNIDKLSEQVISQLESIKKIIESKNFNLD